jgi:DNA-binding LacI/PurR family transcriptional regulator
MKSPTLEDVARFAGVSRGTVSNVFNNPGIVSEAVREKVEAAAGQLGYAGPDPRGRLLQTGKVNAIGVITVGESRIATMFTGYFPAFLVGVAEVCDERGSSLTLISGVADERTRGIRDAVVDGFIISRAHEPILIDSLRRRRLPFVIIDDDGGPETSSVRGDARSGCQRAATHLIDLGHRRFAIMSFLRDLGPATYHPPGEVRSPWIAGMPLDQEKYRGYADAFRRVGIDIGDVPVVQANPWDRDAAALILDKAPDATAILSMSDMQAIAILEEAQRRGRSVPEQLSVVGYNDIPQAALAHPPLTTVVSDGLVRGRRAAQLLFDGGPVRNEVLPTSLVVRGSSGPVAARDRAT